MQSDSDLLYLTISRQVLALGFDNLSDLVQDGNYDQLCHLFLDKWYKALRLSSAYSVRYGCMSDFWEWRKNQQHIDACGCGNCEIIKLIRLSKIEGIYHFQFNGSGMIWYRLTANHCPNRLILPSYFNADKHDNLIHPDLRLQAKVFDTYFSQDICLTVHEMQKSANWISPQVKEHQARQFKFVKQMIIEVISACTGGKVTYDLKKGNLTQHEFNRFQHCYVQCLRHIDFHYPNLHTHNRFQKFYETKVLPLFKKSLGAFLNLSEPLIYKNEGEVKPEIIESYESFSHRFEIEFPFMTSTIEEVDERVEITAYNTVEKISGKVDFSEFSRRLEAVDSPYRFTFTHTDKRKMWKGYKCNRLYEMEDYQSEWMEIKRLRQRVITTAVPEKKLVSKKVWARVTKIFAALTPRDEIVYKKEIETIPNSEGQPFPTLDDQPVTLNIDKILLDKKLHVYNLLKKRKYKSFIGHGKMDFQLKRGKYFFSGNRMLKASYLGDGDIKILCAMLPEANKNLIPWIKNRSPYINEYSKNLKTDLSDFTSGMKYVLCKNFVFNTLKRMPIQADSKKMYRVMKDFRAIDYSREQKLLTRL